MGWIPMDTFISSYLYHCESLVSYPLLSALADDPAFFGGLISFLLFTDYCIYWVHRWLHIPILYKTFHKPHHKWISECSDLKESARSVSADSSLSFFFIPQVPTPFASHAFHPVDGYLQSVPYHLFIFIFPLHRLLYLALFVAVNFWSIFVR